MRSKLTGNLDANNQIIRNSADPIDPQDLVNLRTLQDLINNVTSSNYTHEQNIPASIWNVNHNLNFKPNVRVFTSAGDFMITRIVDIDDNNLQIIIDNPFAGQAYCS